MSKTKSPTHNSRLNRHETDPAGISIRKIMAIGACAAALAGLVITNEQQNQSPEPLSQDSPYRVYKAQLHDTEWGIGQKAFPKGIRPELATEYIHKQNPNDNHLVVPGQEFDLPDSAHIGKLVDPSVNQG